MLWSFETIKQLILEAEEKGYAEPVELSSEREAELFRLAVNNNRRNKNLGPELTTKVKGRQVFVFRRPQLKLKDAAE